MVTVHQSCRHVYFITLPAPGPSDPYNSPQVGVREMLARRAKPRLLFVFSLFLLGFSPRSASTDVFASEREPLPLPDILALEGYQHTACARMAKVVWNIPCAHDKASNVSSVALPCVDLVCGPSSCQTKLHCIRHTRGLQHHHRFIAV